MTGSRTVAFRDGAADWRRSHDARRATWRGARHPVTVVIDEIADIFRELGFTIALGPEAESEWYNFTALNFPPDHPAVDLHDTLYLESGALLRNPHVAGPDPHASAYMPPVRVLVPGNVYRRDFFDASHAPMFAQIEGLAVDEGVSFVDLKAHPVPFCDAVFRSDGDSVQANFFPFTEPSAEMDVECQICKGAGCRTCKGTGWSEIMGCGMVHPSVHPSGRARCGTVHRLGVRDGPGARRAAAVRYPGHPHTLRCRRPRAGRARTMNASMEWLSAFVDSGADTGRAP